MVPVTVPNEKPGGLIEKSFLEHLADLRRTLFGMLASLAVGMVLAIPLTPHALKWLKIPLARAVGNADDFLRVLEISGGFSVALQFVFWIGLLISSPLILFFAGGFVFPGLRRGERRAVVAGMAFAVALFAVGVAMGYFMALPVAVQILLSINDWLGVRVEFVTLTSYVALAVQLLIAFGLAFELPMVLLALGSLGVISSRQLRDKRRHAIVLLFILAMVLTPGPDVVSQVLLGAPLVLLYELCIWLVWLKERRSAKG